MKIKAYEKIYNIHNIVNTVHNTDGSTRYFPQRYDNTIAPREDYGLCLQQNGKRNGNCRRWRHGVLEQRLL